MLLIAVHFWNSIAMIHSTMRLLLATSFHFQKWVGVCAKKLPMPPILMSAVTAATTVTGMSSSICTKSLAVLVHEPPRIVMMSTMVPVSMIVQTIGTSNAAARKTASPLSQIAA